MRFCDHDIHCHSVLSSCSGDERMSMQHIVRHAELHGYSTVCVTDHFWDSEVPGASGWYAPQNLAHVQENLPLPESERVRVCFGCETEYCGGGKLGIAPKTFDAFDFVVIPVNHFHMIGFTRDAAADTEEKIAELFVCRLEELLSISWLPWEKIGLAHLNCSLTFCEGDCFKVFAQMDEARLRRIFSCLAVRGVGIELNAGAFGEDWRIHEDANLRLFRIAKACGCKFYCATDAHHPNSLDYPAPFKEAIALLGLTEEEKYHIPVRV